MAGAFAHGTLQILIRPDLGLPPDVAAVLAHELDHAGAGSACGNEGAFRTVALAIGLKGKISATVPGETFNPPRPSVATGRGTMR